MRLSFKEKAAYGLGAVGKDMVYMLSASYILYYYQDLLGIKGTVMGAIMMAARVFDAFNDPIMEGGMGGTYIKTLGQCGEAKLTIALPEEYSFQEIWKQEIGFVVSKH